MFYIKVFSKKKRYEGKKHKLPELGKTSCQQKLRTRLPISNTAC